LNKEELSTPPPKPPGPTFPGLDFEDIPEAGIVPDTVGRIKPTGIGKLKVIKQQS
jgi:hypothetical protein